MRPLCFEIPKQTKKSKTHQVKRIKPTPLSPLALLSNGFFFVRFFFRVQVNIYPQPEGQLCRCVTPIMVVECEEGSVISMEWKVAFDRGWWLNGGWAPRVPQTNACFHSSRLLALIDQLI